MSGPVLVELRIADEPDAWRAIGFTVGSNLCEVGAVRLRLEGRGPQRGIVSWSLLEAQSLELDGLVTETSAGPPAAGSRHPNSVVSIDHVVVLSPDLDRTVAVLREAGFELRRLREGGTPGGSTRQAFFRVGEPILEVVQAPAGTSVASNPDGPARLWGISFLVDDLDATRDALDGMVGEPRDAVQPGRRIATLRSEAGLGPSVAFMTPGPGAV